jgi:serine/threonine protein kinase
MAERIDIEVTERVRSSSGILYRIVQELGSGGNSHVYLVLALDGPYRGVLFALKIFTRTADADRLKKFKQEFDFLRKTDHPAIMRIYDDGICTSRTSEGTKDLPFMVAEYLPDTLAQALRTRMRTAERLTVALQLLSALVYLDQQPSFVAHRDIKPQNIFLKGRSCVLGDFGLLKIGNDVDTDRKVFKESVGPGMPFFYRTPDLVAYAKNKADLSSKSDVFQLDWCSANCLAGKTPAKRPPTIYKPWSSQRLVIFLGATPLRSANSFRKCLSWTQQ